jgi:hypothetical protein
MNLKSFQTHTAKWLMLEASDRILDSVIHKLIVSLWIKEELLQ